MGARFPGAWGSAAFTVSAEKLPVTQMHIVIVKGHKCPLLFSLTGRLSNKKTDLRDSLAVSSERH